MEREYSKIEGTVDSIIFKNNDNGYTVARASLSDGEEMTVVGVMPFLGVGERIIALGEYVNHPQHGLQFSVSSYEREMPSDKERIYDYLASRAVRGIGPKTARAITDAFGADTFTVLAESPEKLAGIRGISLKKAREIQQEFLRLNSMRMLMEFLSFWDVPNYFVAPLLKMYGEEAVSALKDDPYILCGEPFLLDFAHADMMAKSFGIEPDSRLRLKAALIYELSYNLQNGHAFIPWHKLIIAARDLCGEAAELLESALAELAESGYVVSEEIGAVQACYLEHIWRQEMFLAREAKRLYDMKLVPPPELERLFAEYERRAGLEYDEMQKQAICACFEHGLTLITGGPGTGKTTALQTMTELLEACGMKVLLAAPTGKAAKRMGQICGREAKTLHRLLEAALDESGGMSFRRDRQNPLSADVVIVDEASMLDMALASALMDALKPHTRLVLVGDADQLPPVGAGSCFADLLACGCLGGVRLEKVFRQAQGSDIVLNAHMINRGELPPIRKNTGDFYFMSTRSMGAAIDAVKTLVAERIPERFGVTWDEIQVICPSRQLACGTEAMNAVLQEAVNPPMPGRHEVRFGSAVFRTGDRVMQIRNNYDRMWRKCDSAEAGAGVYNGDTGVITLLDRASGMLVVRFDDREAEYSFDDINELEHAYAMTVHKAQGSEYRVVVIPLFSAPKRLLSRNLLYTAVTRAKELLVIVGREEMIHEMIAQGKKNRRYSALRMRIRELCGDA